MSQWSVATRSVWGTEDALALTFTRRYHRDWRYVAGWGRWLVWDGQRWRTEDTLAATDLIRSVCRHAAVRADNPRWRQAGEFRHGQWRGTAGARRPQARRDHRRMGCRSVAAQYTGRCGRSQTGRKRPQATCRPDDQDHDGDAGR